MFFCIHGAGLAALSFATLAKEVKQFGTVLAFDLKGHGFSKKENPSDDFSIETLCSETIETLKELLQRFPEKNVVIVGHSLGGSVACRITDALTNVEKLDRVVGCIVIDVVEGTAIEALPFMNQIIADRPKHFDSLESAIKWW
jgi:protein phosphatase methylesterase 1